MIFNPFIQDRAKLNMYYEEWRKKQIPVAKCNAQTFILFLIHEGILTDDDIHDYVREKDGM